MRENILLAAVNAKYIHSNLAVYSLRSYAAEYRDRIGLAEYTINNRMEQILQDIYKRRPKVLCFSCYIWNISMSHVERFTYWFLPDETEAGSGDAEYVRRQWGRKCGPYYVLFDYEKRDVRNHQALCTRLDSKE